MPNTGQKNGWDRARQRAEKLSGSKYNQTAAFGFRLLYVPKDGDRTEAREISHVIWKHWT
jgi:hypothetical protein